MLQLNLLGPGARDVYVKSASSPIKLNTTVVATPDMLRTQGLLSSRSRRSSTSAATPKAGSLLHGKSDWHNAVIMPAENASIASSK